MKYLVGEMLYLSHKFVYVLVVKVTPRGIKYINIERHNLEKEEASIQFIDIEELKANSVSLGMIKHICRFYQESQKKQVL